MDNDSISIPGRCRNFSLHHQFHSSYEISEVLYTKGTGEGDNMAGPCKLKLKDEFPNTFSQADF
jgi:hypothetical protein